MSAWEPLRHRAFRILERAFGVAAAGLVAGPLLGRGRLRPTRTGLDLEPTQAWGEPHLVFDAAPDSGPVLVTVDWRVREQDADAFEAAMRPVERIRRRTGDATRWGLFQDGEDAERFPETSRSRPGASMSASTSSGSRSATTSSRRGPAR